MLSTGGTPATRALDQPGRLVLGRQALPTVLDGPVDPGVAGLVRAGAARRCRRRSAPAGRSPRSPAGPRRGARPASRRPRSANSSELGEITVAASQLPSRTDGPRRCGTVRHECRCPSRPRPSRGRADLPGLAAGGGVPDAAEQPRPGGRRAPGRPRRVRRHRPGGPLVGRVRRHGPHAAHARRRRDDARPVGQAGRRVPHPRVGTAGAARQLQPRAGLGDVGRVPAARGRRAHDVRPDDGRLVDLHRHPGDPPGHVRVLRRDRPPPLRRHAGRHDHADRRARRHGWRAAAGDHDERRRGAVRRRRPGARPAPHRHPVPRRGRRRPRRRRRPLHDGPRRAAGAVGRASSATPPTSLPRLLDARLPGRHRHRPDERPRPAVVRARRRHAGGRRRDGAHRSRRC